MYPTITFKNSIILLKYVQCLLNLFSYLWERFTFLVCNLLIFQYLWEVLEICSIDPYHVWDFFQFDIAKTTIWTNLIFFFIYDLIWFEKKKRVTFYIRTVLRFNKFIDSYKEAKGLLVCLIMCLIRAPDIALHQIHSINIV